MRWKNPSQKTQNMLIAPIAILMIVPCLTVLVPMIPLFWAVNKYANWQQDRGWHRWFAWHPVYCGNPWDHERPCRWVWLETIYRHSWVYASTEYRWPEQVPA